jgi:acyl carrier protein
MVLEEVKSKISKRKEVLDRVKKVIISKLNLSLSPEQIDDDAPLFGMGLGLDSIDALELSIGVEEEFGVHIGEEDFSVFLSVNTLVDFILESTKKPVYSFNLSEEDMKDALSKCKEIDRIWDAYKCLREGAIIYTADLGIIEVRNLENQEENLRNFISRYIPGKDVNLYTGRGIHTCVLNEEGKLLDFVYVLAFDDKYWFVFPTSSSEGKKFLEEGLKKEGVRFADVSNDYSTVVCEGPYSWRFEKILGEFEIPGLGYLRFFVSNFDNKEVVVFRSGENNEYGYRNILPKSQSQKLVESMKQKSDDSVPFVLLEDREVLDNVFAITKREVRFPSLGITVPSMANPVNYELRWMVDFSKDFLGKDSIVREVENLSFRVVGFQIESDVKEVKPSVLVGKSVYVEDLEIGEVLNVAFSPFLKKWIGYVKLSPNYAYPGVEYSIKLESGNVYILTQSTPFFFTKSSITQIE